MTETYADAGGLLMARAGGRSTARAESTQPREESPAVLALNWISPEARSATPLKGPVVIGRDEDCTASVQGDQVSRRHAEIRRVSSAWKLFDLESTNGSFVNGERVNEQTLNVGDLVRIGEWIAMVTLVDSGSEFESTFGELASGMFGAATLARALRPALRAAKSDLPLIIEGETGTGKERVARALHELSERKGDFIAVNCAALPESLAEAELFGYRKGAFTGADRSSPGCFRAASGGTLLLDEISDLPLAVQGKLLRVLEQREVLPLGETRPVGVDVRVVAASQQPLHEVVAEGLFRADLFARLEGMSIRLPPLRERLEDVPFLLRHFVRELGEGQSVTLEPKLVEQLCMYDWPFNVRELVQLVRRLLALHGEESVLKRAYLPERFQRTSWRGGRPAPRSAPSVEAPPRSRRPVLTLRDEADLTRLIDALRANGGNVARAATAVGITRQRAYRLMEAQDEIDLVALRRVGPNEGS